MKTGSKRYPLQSILPSPYSLTGQKLIRHFSICLAALAAFWASRATADSFSFSTGDPDGKIATGARPASPGKIETETADDFTTTATTTFLNQASFTGLIPAGTPLSSINQVSVAFYHVFPKDSDTGRTPLVPTRVNSPADDEFLGLDSTTPGDLTFTTTILNSSFSAANSVLNGIHPKPNQTTGGEGAVRGTEVRVDVTFTSPVALSADHYFFVPEVGLDQGDFLWLSAPKPIVAPGTPFSPDLQSWMRNADLDPDWLRIGTDIVGPTGNTTPTYNAAFSLTGVAVPDTASTLTLLMFAALALTGFRAFLGDQKC